MATVILRRAAHHAGWWARLRQWRSYWLGPYGGGDKALAQLIRSGPTTAGVSVTEDTAFNYAAFWQGVSLIAGHLASFPLITYKRLQGGGKERMTSHRLYRLLHDEWNPEMSSYTARETLQAHALSWGNGYAEIERDGQRRPIHLWPITPDRVTPVRDPSDAQLYYRVANPSGVESIIPATNMLHLVGFGYDGLQGYSVVRRARESLSLSLAAEQFGAAFFGNGSTFGGMIIAEQGFENDEQEKEFRAGIEDYHKGGSKAHRFLVLTGGLKYEKLGVPPEDAQFLETRKFQIEEIARWLNLPPHKLKHLDRATNNNIEHQGIEYYTDTLYPWQVRWEQEFNRKLIAPLERNLQFVEHLVDGVLRGDIQSRYQAYAVGRQWGWLSADDIRQKENMNPLPDGAGQIYLVPQNMAPADRINEVIDAQVAKAAPTPTETEVASALARASQAEASATAARAEAVAATARAIEASTSLTATREERDRLETTAREASALATQLTGLATELRAQAEALADAKTRVEADLAEAVTARTVAERRAEAAFAEAARAQEAVTMAETAAADAETRVREAATAQTEALAARDAAVARAIGAEHLAADTMDARTHAETEAEAHRTRLSADLVHAETAAEEARTRERLARETTDRQIAEAEARIAAVEAAQALEMQRREEADTLLTAALAARTALEQTRDATTAELARVQGEYDATTVRLAEAAAAAATAETARATAQQRAHARLTAVLAAHRALIVDALGRMTRREAEKARRHQATPDKLRAWLEGFRSLHAEVCLEALRPAIRVHLAWQRPAEDPEAVTHALVTAHLDELERRLQAVLATDVGEYHATLERMLTRWEVDQAEDVADGLLTEAIAALRTLEYPS